MSETLARAFAGDIEVRAAGEGRTVAGLVVPYDRTARVSDGGPSYDEMFVMGAFKRSIKTPGRRVPLLSQHASRENPLGRATLLREDPAGLYGEFVVSRTQAGDEALELIRDGALDSFSVGFTPIKHEKRNGTVVRTEAGIRETSVVTFAAYSDARISAVRELADEVGEDPDVLVSLLRDFVALNASATTPDGDSEQASRTVEDPASATPDAITHFRHLRKIAREKGII